jgi:large subunit ribosomal protein L33
MIKLTSIGEVLKMSDKVILTCTECLSRNYTTTKNKKTHLERIELSKFCKKCGKHTLHKETK